MSTGKCVIHHQPHKSHLLVSHMGSNVFIVPPNAKRRGGGHDVDLRSMEVDHTSALRQMALIKAWCTSQSYNDVARLQLARW